LTDEKKLRVARPDDFIPEVLFPEGHRHAGKRRCQAWSNNNGRQCMGLAMQGKDVCRSHGGKARKGIEHPNARTLRYSKDLPIRLLQDYQRALTDTELLRLDEEIGLVEARISEVLRRLESGLSGDLMRQIRTAYHNFRRGMRNEDQEMMGRALATLDRLINRGISDYAAWNEAQSLIEQRRRLVESERKRRMDMKTILTAEQGIAMITAIYDILTHHVKDKHTLSSISRELERIVIDHPA